MKAFFRAPRLTVGAVAVATCAALSVGGFAVAASAADTATVSDVILLTGADENQRVVSWYADAATDQVVQVVPANKVRNGVFPETGAIEYAGVVAANKVNGGFNGHAVLTGLKTNQAYAYRVGSAGAWSEVENFRTYPADGNFDFLFYGDPQVGASGDLAADQAGWESTVAQSLAANPDAELLVSGGDQVNTANIEAEWDAFLAPEGLRSVPWVSTIGNHDVGGKAYEQHLWTPNTDRSPSFYKAGGLETQSGGDYWFTHNGVLFIDLNSNAYSSSASGQNADEAHLAYVRKVIEEQGANASATVLVYHHAIYSPASHANDGDAQIRRREFPTVFSELGVDLVLQGHDHAYSRSYEIRNGVKANPDEQPGANEIFQGEGGVVYVTANSASGSKYYGLTDPKVGSDFGPDPLNPGNHWANSVEIQDFVPEYVKVEVRADKLVVSNVRTGATATVPTGAVVDEVTIHKHNDKVGHGAEKRATTTTEQDVTTVTTLD